MNLKRLLLAEDNENDIELTLAALRKCKLANEVDVVRDGAEVLDYLYRKGVHAGRPNGLPSVMLLDLKMPRMDGLEVLQQIKSDPGLKRLPVVMLTSSTQEEDLIRSYDLGVNAFVVKPVDFSQFVEAIHRLGVFWALVNQTAPDRPIGT
ncbi:MAG: response regulator [Methylacidiphilales bacterium]|nr:response regulator [Candidatus Methylacidiphilales bacterium]